MDVDGLVFFFQAEDGIRDLTVTGVQTCALPIALRDPTHRHPRCGLARAGALEDVAHVAVVVLERAGEVRVAGPRPRDRQIRVAVLGAGRHLLLPVSPGPVLDPERDRRAEGLAP